MQTVTAEQSQQLPEAVSASKPDIENQQAQQIAVEGLPVTVERPTVRWDTSTYPAGTVVFVPTTVVNPPPDDQREYMTVCAIFGLIFSWIPIVGCATFLFNLDAPQGSIRRFLSSSACCVAMIVVIFNIFFWPFR